MTLTAATFLGDNTIVPLSRLVATITELGVAAEVVGLDRRTSDDARSTADAIDLVWICGGLFTALRDDDTVTHDVIAVPTFAGESPGRYHSVVVARSDGPADLATALHRRVAVNEPASWSGHLGLRRHLDGDWFATEVVTGSHRASIAAVADGRADVAAIDSTIWAALGRDEPAAVDGLRVIDRTADWPAPPLTLHPRVAAEDRRVVLEAVRGFGPAVGIERFETVDSSIYEVMR